jgi:hypothetical protein
MKSIIESISKGPVGTGDDVKPGECAYSIASAANADWRKLWLSANDDLKDARQHPSLLLPGDKVTLPDPEPKDDEEDDVDTEHVYRLKPKPKWTLSLRFTQFGQPRKNIPFSLQVLESGDSAEPIAKGNLDEKGVLSHDGMELEWTKVKVVLGEEDAPESEYEFEIGAVGPPTEPRGIQARLWNLGYFHDDLSDEFTVNTENALRRFMAKNGLLAACDQDVDEDKVKEGLAQLVRAHGC